MIMVAPAGREAAVGAALGLGRAASSTTGLGRKAAARQATAIVPRTWGPSELGPWSRVCGSANSGQMCDHIQDLSRETRVAYLFRWIPRSGLRQRSGRPCGVVPLERRCSTGSRPHGDVVALSSLLSCSVSSAAVARPGGGTIGRPRKCGRPPRRQRPVSMCGSSSAGLCGPHDRMIGTAPSVAVRCGSTGRCCTVGVTAPRQ